MDTVGVADGSCVGALVGGSVVHSTLTDTSNLNSIDVSLALEPFGRNDRDIQPTDRCVELDTAACIAALAAASGVSASGARQAMSKGATPTAFDTTHICCAAR